MSTEILLLTLTRSHVMKGTLRCVSECAAKAISLCCRQPCPVVVVCASGIKVSSVQDTQQNSADRSWFYNRNNLQLAADTVSSVLWWQNIDLLLNIYPKEFFKTKQSRAICSACEWFIDCGKVRILQWHTHCKQGNVHFREQTLAGDGYLVSVQPSLSSILPHGFRKIIQRLG